MFSGIVECTSNVLEILQYQEGAFLRFKIQRPQSFSDVKPGDSIAVNGVCLTVESFDQQSLQFAVGEETLKVTEWSEEFLNSTPLNLERSLRLGDRIHGHLMTGHVDERGQVASVKELVEGKELWIQYASQSSKFFWPKGSVCLNGVSLTINEVKGDQLRVNLIPETLNMTNLGFLKEGDPLNIEMDSFARGLIHYFKEREP